MTEPKDNGQETVQTVTILDLAAKNGKVPFPPNFGQDGNALALVSSAKNMLKKGGWPAEDIKTFTTLALSGDYNATINSCLTVFK